MRNLRSLSNIRQGKIGITQNEANCLKRVYGLTGKFKDHNDKCFMHKFQLVNKRHFTRYEFRRRKSFDAKIWKRREFIYFDEQMTKKIVKHSHPFFFHFKFDTERVYTIES